MTDKPTTSSAAEFALQALVAAGHVSQELVDKAMALPGASQPAHSGEPVATVIKRGASRDWMSERLGGLPDGVYSLFTAPQPVERVPLTDEQIDEIHLANSDAYERGDVEYESHGFARAVEAHHGIKEGGQPARAAEPLFPFRHGCKWCGKTPVCEHTPQPIQTQPVARGPLTHAQAKALVLKYGNDPLHLVYQVEVAHGIKGGQHGTDTK